VILSNYLTRQKIFSKQRVIMGTVVTQFWTPRAGDGVYLFWTKCRSLAHICQKIDKSTERNILFFLNLVWAVFCSFYPSPLLPKSSGSLRLIRSLHNAKLVLFFIWSLRLNKSLRICTKKWFCCCRNFLFQLRLWFWPSFVRYLTILGIFYNSLHVEKLMYTFIRS
jgi:hypothetical protein